MKRGFTLVELIVVLGVMGVLLGLLTINLLKPQINASTTGVINSLVTDLRQAQIKAMVGEGSSGVRFGTTSYTVFTGSDEFVVNLPANMEFSEVTFPNAEVVFASVSGEVIGFDANNASVKVGHVVSVNKEKLTLNRLGVVTNEE